MKLIRLVCDYFRINLAAAMEYRAAFLSQAIGMAVNNSAFILFWIIMYHQAGPSIEGYSFRDVMFLWSLAPLGFGISIVFFGNSVSISKLIYSGELDVYMLQPKPLVLNMLASKMYVPGLGDMAYGVILFLATQPLTLTRIGLFVLFSLAMAAVLIGLRLFYHSFTFFFGNAEEFASMAAESVLSLILYPGTIFKGPVLWLFRTLFPAVWIAYIPVRLIQSFDLALLFITLGADILIVTAGVMLFYSGLKHYESGNRIGARM
ncbi:MAG: ABC-2 family transporter protein [Spirochaetales bacterium]|nr:ABC-2 family transporter protein [Spirochaetales bacterium]